MVGTQSYGRLWHIYVSIEQERGFICVEDTDLPNVLDTLRIGVCHNHARSHTLKD